MICPSRDVPRRDWFKLLGGVINCCTSINIARRCTHLEQDGVAQSVEHWTANLAARVRSPVGEEPSNLICAFLHVQMEFNWAGLSVCNCRHTGNWCGTIKAVGNTDHTRQTWIHMQTPLSPLAGCGPVGEGTSGKVLNWTVRSLNHAYTTATTHLEF